MARLLRENVWYEALAKGSAATVTESLLRLRSAVLFPDFRFVPIREQFFDDPDQIETVAMLLEHTYRSWWLLRLSESPSPSLTTYKEECRAVRERRYGAEFRERAVKADSSIDPEKLGTLLDSRSPGLFVITSTLPPIESDDANLQIGVAELFSSSTGEYIIRINGQHPEPKEEKVATCVRNARVNPRILKMTFEPGQTLTGTQRIDFIGTTGDWNIRELDNATYLIPPSTVLLSTSETIFTLVRSASAVLRLTTADE